MQFMQNMQGCMGKDCMGKDHSSSLDPSHQLSSSRGAFSLE